ncbi:MAG: 4a-hydroxytetrahydrobiopterin dehydratase [Myxococcaceae bacterium]|nr:4a-hydroxytetrahydrobiopterin dehydratase [Myxococcaceae bacterium]
MDTGTRLNDAELALAREALPDWSVDAQELRRNYEFATFLDAVAFVQCVAQAAEEADHHPDIDIRYTMVTLALTTHDAGGVTEKDTALASTCEELFALPAFSGDGEDPLGDEGEDGEGLSDEAPDEEAPSVPALTFKRPIIG